MMVTACFSKLSVTPVIERDDIDFNVNFNNGVSRFPYMAVRNEFKNPGGEGAKIQDFRENPRFSRKSEIFAKIRDFRENPKFSRKSGIFAKI